MVVLKSDFGEVNFPLCLKSEALDEYDSRKKILENIVKKVAVSIRICSLPFLLFKKLTYHRLTRQTIGLIEAGDYNPTLNLCIAICRALNKTLNDLFWEDMQ